MKKLCKGPDHEELSSNQKAQRSIPNEERRSAYIPGVEAHKGIAT